MSKRLIKIARRLYKSGENLRAGSLFEQAGELEMAMKAYADAGKFVKAGDLAIGIGQGELAVKHYLRAGRFDLIGDFHEARKNYEDAARFYARAGNYNKAADMYEILLKEFPDFKGIPGEMTERSPTEVKLTRLAASTQARASNYARAAELYYRIEQFDEAAHNLLLNKDFIAAGEAYEAAGLFAEAGQAYSEGGYHLQAGESFVKEHSYRLAAESFLKGKDFKQSGEFFEKSGDPFAAADAYAQGENLDLSIKVLSYIEADHIRYVEAVREIIYFSNEKGYVSPAAKRFFMKFVAEELNSENFELCYQIAMLFKESEFVKEHDRLLTNLRNLDADQLMKLQAEHSVVEAETAKSAQLESILEEDFEAKTREQAFMDRKKRLEEALQPGGDTSETIEAVPDSSTSSGILSSFDSSYIKEGNKFSNRYLLLKHIGSGGMGSVYKATDLELDEPVAIKFLSPQQNIDDTAVARFKQEIKLARQINHPNIIRIYDLGEYRGIRFITMEYFPGRQIKEIVNSDGFFSVPAGLDLVLKVCSGLIAAHKKGIIHRDIKSQNIMTSDDKVVKVLDFGIAKSADIPGLTIDGSILGTPEYISPEAIMQKPVDARSDIYSLGIVMFEIFAGSVPFTGDNIMSIIRQHLYEDPPNLKVINNTVPDDLDEIVMRCLAREPDDRYQSVAELRAELQMLKLEYGNEDTVE